MEKTKRKNKNTAIVVGSKGVNATGLIRSLGQAGFSVTFASSYSKIESKWTTDYLKLPQNEEAMVKTLLDYIKSLSSKPALFTVDDSINFILDSHYEEFKDISYCPNVKGNMKENSDKINMSQLAQQSGLNVAPFFKLDIKNAEEKEIEFPVIVKPYAGYAGSKGDIRVCRNKDEYQSCVERLKQKEYTQVMVQKLIESQDQFEIGLMGFSLPDGRVEIPCSIKKIRSYPTGRGSTSYAQIKNDFFGVDIEALKSFVRSTNYSGVFDVEMIISDAKAYFIEINYRNGQYGYAPTAAGYNIPANWFKGMLGEDTEKTHKVNEIFYINERDDYLHIKNGEISRSQWFRDFRSATAYGTYCPKDQRPWIRQYAKIPDRVVMLFNRIKARIKDLLIKEEWNVALREKADDLLFRENGTQKPFNVLPNTWRYWAADPFVISKDDKDYLFFEMFDRIKSKGLIGYRVIENGKAGKMNIAYEAKSHLSFPFIFTHNGDYYMMPESSEEKHLPILKAVSFPDNWEEVKSFMDGKRVVDSSMLRKDGETYLFTQDLKQSYTSAEASLYVYKNDSWQEHPENPIVKNSTVNSRLAGAVIEAEEGLIRVTQDCSEDYGKQLSFNLIEELSDTQYIEKMIAQVSLDNIKIDIDKNKFRGVHTYNSSDRYEVVDLKNIPKLRIGNILNLFYRLIKK